MNEIITSTGTVGADYNRSEGRAYLTEERVLNCLETVLERFEDLRAEALAQGRRRWVFRGIFEGRLDGLVGSNLVEVNIPLSVIDSQSKRRLVILAGNIHRSEVPEWEEVYAYWQRLNRNPPNPLHCVASIPAQFRLTDRATLDDLEDLTEIWQPFGWTRTGVGKFIENYRQKNIWFSGIRDTMSGRLISACQGESIEFTDLLLVEGTEYGTLSDFERKGLCTGAVVGLHAQILRDTLYQKSQIPLIYSELNMTVRSDVIARKAGMIVPDVEGNTSLTQPTQVLRRNVSILDRHGPNDLSLDELGTQAEYFRTAYGVTFPYWRNFIVGILTKEAIDRYYSKDQCREILNYYE